MTITRKAYSVINVKDVDEEKRVIEGIASTPTVDRMGDIVEPMGAKFALPMPLLLYHSNQLPVGNVTFAKPNKNGIPFRAEIPRVTEPGTVKDRVDEAWHSLKYKLIGAVSIGFQAVRDAVEMLDDGGLLFKEWEWLELSLVTVPANPDARLTGVKSIDAQLRAASGTPQKGKTKPPGVSGKKTSVNLRPKEDTMNLKEQIQALEAKRSANVARMEEIMQKAADEGRSSDEAEQEEFDTLQSECEQVEKDLTRLRALKNAKEAEEQRQAQSATPAVGDTRTTASQSRGGVHIQAVQQKMAPGIGFARLAKVKALAKLDGESPRQLAKELYGENSPVYGVLNKAAVPAGNTGNDNWAGNLVGDETSVFADFVEFLRPQTIVGRFGSEGIPALRQVPFRVPLVGQDSGGSGYWVGEGKAKPLTKFDFSRRTLEPLKVANIAVVTDEILRDSSPSAEMIVRDSLAAALIERMDTDFIDPSKAASSGVSPASITNGISPIPSLGVTADNVRGDIRAIFNAFILANNAPTSGVWIMPATTALALSLMQNPLGQAEFPGITMNGGTLFGLPVIVSQYMPGTSDGAYVALVNASDIYWADEGGISVDMSREASLQMDDAPTQNSDTPTASQMVSLWQTNSVGFRAERTVNWLRRRTSGVALLSEVDWGGEEAGGG